MRSDSAVLDDTQAVMTIQRGTSFQLTLFQEEYTDENGVVTAPAKSFTICRREAAIALRDLLNKALEDKQL